MGYNVTISGTDYEGIDTVKLPLTGENKQKAFGDVDGIIDGTITSCESDVTQILKYKFMNCSKLKNVRFPNVKSIGIGAFDSCTSLEEADIFDKVEKISDTAFYNCSKITGELNMPSLEYALGKNAFFGCVGITKVVMPKVRGTGQGSFNKCTGLKVVDLGNVLGTTSNQNVDIVNQQLFTGCSNLEAVIIRTPSIVVNLFAANAFEETPISNGTASDSCFIYVPKSLIDSYKADTKWSTFANQFRAIEDYPDICG